MAKKIHLSSTHCSFEKTKQKQKKAPAFFLLSTLFLVLEKSINIALNKKQTLMQALPQANRLC